MELVKDIALLVFILAFLVGVLTSVFTGTGRYLKILLAFLTVFFILVSIGGFFVTSGWLIFLYTQLIVLWLIIYGVIVVGAVAGGGIWLLMHRRRLGDSLSGEMLPEYLTLAEFALKEGITEERALGRVRSGFYRGGRHEGVWYVHQSELSAS